MKTLAKLSVFVVGTLMLLAALSPALALPSLVTAPSLLTAPPMISESINGNSVTSSNWGGYAVTAPSGSVTYASGSWKVPTLATTSSTTFAACWTGIDGAFTSNTVEQIGTLCSTGDYAAYGIPSAYLAWYEFYPYEAIIPISMAISAGNTMFASVTYSTSPSAEFTLYIKDVTTGISYSTTATVSSLGYTPARSTAEWIIEAPASGRSVLPLANFGTALYGQDNTGVVSPTYPANCYATISGTTDPIGTLTSVSGTTIYQITMMDGRATAMPSALSTDQTSFTVAYSSAAPPPDRKSVV